jgi:hypothetical protein
MRATKEATSSPEIPAGALDEVSQAGAVELVVEIGHLAASRRHASPFRVNVLAAPGLPDPTPGRSTERLARGGVDPCPTPSGTRSALRNGPMDWDVRSFTRSAPSQEVTYGRFTPCSA